MRTLTSNLLLRRTLPALPLGAVACGPEPGAGATDGTSAGTTGTTSTGTTTGTQPTDGSASAPTSTGGCPVGSETCPCTQGGGCDPGLVCLSNLCVDPGGGTSTGPGGTTDAVTGTTSGSSTTGGTTDASSTGGGPGGSSTTGGQNATHPSCQGIADDACGGDDCCVDDPVPAGWSAMGRGEKTACQGMPSDGQNCAQTPTTCFAAGVTWGCPAGKWMKLGGDDGAAGNADEVPEHAARVDAFGLDRYEVTVGRMRTFVGAYDKAALLALLEGGAGSHPVVAGTAWQNAWDAQLPADGAALAAALTCNATHTWTDAPGPNETAPINCISWYVGYAFCAWDEGRLPTEAEWERAAIGGEENRLYPWGADAPSAMLANYSATDKTPTVDVFAKPAGAGRWGHQQIAGSVWEWVFDANDPAWYAGAGKDCQNCANVSTGGARILRGGNFEYNAINLRGADRFPGTPGAAWLGAGLRCARD